MQIAASNTTIVYPVDISAALSFTEYTPNTYFRIKADVTINFGEVVPVVGAQFLFKCLNATATLATGGGIYYNGATSVGTQYQNSNVYGNFILTYTGLINDNVNFDLSGDLSNTAP